MINLKNLLLVLLKFYLILEKASSQSLTLFGCLVTEPICPNVNITFYLYTRETQENPTKLDLLEPSSILTANYIPNRPFILIIHGYVGSKDLTPNIYLRPAFFQKDDYNIISVDYEELVKSPCYATAVGNLPTVANCTAQLIDFMLDTKIFSIDAIHIIGFSLGGQTSGMVANYLKEGRKLKRITALDPAKPLFVRVGNEGRIDESDADFVDIIHTDVFGRGVLVPTGHVDIYVNGGFLQTGCIEQTELSVSSCNHDRAPQYYAESINTQIGFFGFQCAHWYFYVLGVCREDENNSSVEMGYNINETSRGLYFLHTNARPPYARGKNFSTNSYFLQDELNVNKIDDVA